MICKLISFLKRNEETDQIFDKLDDEFEQVVKEWKNDDSNIDE